MNRTRLLVAALALAALATPSCSRLFRPKPTGAVAPGAEAEAESAVPRGLLPFGRDDGMDVPATIRGEVVKVDKLVGVAVISVGEMQGVRPRYAFHVLREGRLIGKLVVEETFDDMSACRYGKTMLGHVEVGDEVATRAGAD